MSLGGIGFYSLTTTVAPGAGTKIGAHEEIIGGNKVYYQGVVVGFLSPGGIFCPASVLNPLPVDTIGNAGTPQPIFAEANTSISEQTLASYTVPANKVFKFISATLACSFDGVMRVKVNGTVVRVIRTGPGQPTVSIPIVQSDVAAGQVITVTHESRVGVPPSALVAVSVDGKLYSA
jgi:hypothetical protein